MHCKSNRKGKLHVGKMDTILTDSHLDTTWDQVMYPDECDSTNARICRGSMGREREVLETAGNSTDDSS